MLFNTKTGETTMLERKHLHLNDLPEEMIGNICSFLNNRDVACLGQTSKHYALFTPCRDSLIIQI